MPRIPVALGESFAPRRTPGRAKPALLAAVVDLRNLLKRREGLQGRRLGLAGATSARRQPRCQHGQRRKRQKVDENLHGWIIDGCYRPSQGPERKSRPGPVSTVPGRDLNQFTFRRSQPVQEPSEAASSRNRNRNPNKPKEPDQQRRPLRRSF